MAEDLRAKVIHVLRGTGEGFEQVFPGSTNRFVGAVVPALENLLATLDRFGEEPLRSQRSGNQPDHYILAWQLLWEACNALLAAFTLFQRGYATESLAVTRGVFERVACALVLFDNPGLLPRFTAGALGDLASIAVGPASRVIRDFGRVYGLLTELGAHIGKDNVGTGIIGIEREETVHHLHLAIGGNIPTTGPDVEGWTDMVSEFCEIAERILAPAPEQLFFNAKRVTAKLKKTGTSGPGEVM